MRKAAKVQHKFTLEDTVYLEDSCLVYPFYFIITDLIIILYDPEVITAPLDLEIKELPLKYKPQMNIQVFRKGFVKPFMIYIGGVP